MTVVAGRRRWRWIHNDASTREKAPGHHAGGFNASDPPRHDHNESTVADGDGLGPYVGDVVPCVVPALLCSCRSGLRGHEQVEGCAAGAGETSLAAGGALSFPG